MPKNGIRDILLIFEEKTLYQYVTRYVKFEFKF